MFYLAGSIILSTYLLLAFKVLQRMGISAFQAIVFNYCACVATGIVFQGNFKYSHVEGIQPWFVWAALMGGLLITLFNLIGFTTRQIGIAVASVSNKLSLVIPVLFSMALYGERPGQRQVAGIVLALAAVVLICWPGGPAGSLQERKSPAALIRIVAPVLLFCGSGLLDTLVKYVQKTYLNEFNSNSFLVTAFAFAGGTGLIILLLLVAAGREHISNQGLIAGLLIGVPNYFSIWFLTRVLKHYEGRSTAIIPINNMCIVLLSALLGWIIFKEQLSWLNRLGIILSIFAIALIAFG